MCKEAASIILEGLDGAGKTTHITRLSEELQALGLRTIVMASPGRGTLTGNILRANIGKIDPHRASKLFAYDIERSQRRILPNTDVVFWDRNIDSVRTSNSTIEEATADIGDRALKITQPNKTIYLSIPPEESLRREEATSKHPINLEWLKAKYSRYQTLIRQAPERFTVVDATQPLDTVYQALLGLVLEDLGPAIESQKKIHRLLLNTPGVIKFVLNNPVEVKPGIFLPMFVNIKATMGEVDVRNQIVESLLEIAGKSHYDSVLGLESGGSYYAVTLANLLHLPVAFHRTKNKTYSGATSDIVGVPPTQGSRVLMVDDVYATGQSAFRALKRMEQFGCEPNLLTAYSYSSDTEMKERLGANATSLTYFKGMRHLARENGTLSNEEASKLTQLVDVYRNSRFE